MDKYFKQFPPKLYSQLEIATSLDFRDYWSREAVKLLSQSFS